MLRKLVEARPWVDAERAEAMDLLNELEQVHALGTLTGRLDKRDHDHERGGPWFPQSMQCHVCGAGMDAPPHAHLPVEVKTNIGWRGVQMKTEIRCKVCNKETV